MSKPVAEYKVSEIDKVARDLESAARELKNGQSSYSVLVRTDVVSGYIVRVTDVDGTTAEGISALNQRPVTVDLTTGKLTEHAS